MNHSSNLKFLKWAPILFFIAFGYCLSAQVNLKVGYNLGFADLEQTNSIFERFNAENPHAEKLLTPVNTYHGIDLGLRYKFDKVGIDVSLSSLSGSTESMNVMQLDGSLGDGDWRISTTTYAIGLETYFGVIGLGGNIGMQKLKYRTDLNSNSGKKTIYSESVLSSKFYLIIEVPSNKIAFSMRPFISTTWQPHNIQGVELAINPQSMIPASEFDQDLFMYGISFLFYNGPQGN